MDSDLRQNDGKNKPPNLETLAWQSPSNTNWQRMAYYVLSPD